MTTQRRRRRTSPVLLLALSLVAATTVVDRARAEDPATNEAAKGEKMTVAVMKTNMGDIVLRFYEDVAPKACENFELLAEKGYYDGLIFHRVIEGFMIQGGDPLGTGYGGKSAWGKPFEDETSPDHRFTRKGLLAMANAGPNTNGSQFFITLAPCDWLDGRHTIFGEVIEGQDVVDAIGSVEVTPGNDKPVKPVVIESITYEERVVGE